jgi:hypothetical protein
MTAARIAPVWAEGNNSMKAIQITSTGGPEVLEYRTVPDPIPKSGEVLILVHTSGVNFIVSVRGTHLLGAEDL